MRADKFLFHHANMGRRLARKAIAEGRVWVNGKCLEDQVQDIGAFDHVSLDGVELQNRKPLYVMLHKPAGYVCATKDKESPTVMELLPAFDEPLHLVGRLDKFTTGLVLLTNDGQWSRMVSDPKSKFPKEYEVRSEKPIDAEMIEAFQRGVYFEKESVTSQPAQVQLLEETRMRLTIYEGLHHQIKRMLLKFGNRVVSLHRIRVAHQALDIEEGKWRFVDPSEVVRGRRAKSDEI